jgi:hypothetical protein
MDLIRCMAINSKKGQQDNYLCKGGYLYYYNAKDDKVGIEFFDKNSRKRYDIVEYEAVTKIYPDFWKIDDRYAQLDFLLEQHSNVGLDTCKNCEF